MHLDRRTILKATAVGIAALVSPGVASAQSRYYDFNASFEPLTVLDQQGGDCIAETRATMACAFMRAYEGVVRNWSDAKVKWVEDDNDVCLFHVATPAGARTAHYAPPSSDYFTDRGLDRYSFAGLDFALRHNAVLQLCVPGDCYTFAGCYTSKVRGVPWRTPVIGTKLDNGSTTLNHSLLAVGVRPKGLLVQNSWGPKWGKHGRAVLSWEFLRSYSCPFTTYTWGSHALDELNL